MVVVYDPKGGYYFWHINVARFPSDATNLSSSLAAGSDAFYVSPIGLIEFAMPGDLGVLARGLCAKSLDAALSAAIEEVRRSLTVLSGSGYDAGYKQLEVGRQIGRQWSCPDSDDANFDPLCTFHVKRFASISRQGDNWRLVAQNRWDQEIILDSKFNFVSTRRLPVLSK